MKEKHFMLIFIQLSQEYWSGSSLQSFFHSEQMICLVIMWSLILIKECNLVLWKKCGLKV